MIVIKVELWKGGYESNKEEIGRMTIANKCDSDNPKRGNYTVNLMRRGTEDSVLKTVEIKDYPRQSYTVWKLVKLALEKLL